MHAYRFSILESTSVIRLAMMLTLSWVSRFDCVDDIQLATEHQTLPTNATIQLAVVYPTLLHTR